MESPDRMHIAPRSPVSFKGLLPETRMYLCPPERMCVQSETRRVGNAKDIFVNEQGHNMSWPRISACPRTQISKPWVEVLLEPFVVKRGHYSRGFLVRLQSNRIRTRLAQTAVTA